MKSRSSFLLAIVCWFLPMACGAGVVEYQLIKARGYQQTAEDTAPAEAEAFVFFSDLFTDVGEFVAVSLEGPTGGDLDYEGPFINEDGLDDRRIERDFDSQDDLDAAFPDDATYIIEAVTPEPSVVSEMITFSTSFPEAVPFFTGPVFRSLQGMDTTQDFTFTFPEGPAGAEALLLIDVVTPFGNTEIFDTDVTGETSFVLPAGTLSPDQDYLAVLAYLDRVPDTLDDFTTGSGRSGHGVFTELAFTTSVVVVPEPAVAGLAAALAASLGLVARRKRTG